MKDNYTFSEVLGLGFKLAKIEYWSNRYRFGFQYWGPEGCNVYIYRDDVEIASFGGRETISELLDDVIEWCEKAYPRYQYPKGLVITNPQD